MRSTRSLTSRAAFLGSLAVSLLAAACTRTRVENSLAVIVASGDVNADLDFWDAIAKRPVVSNDEGIHGLLLFADGQDLSKNYAERLAAARARGWIDTSWNEPSDLAMQRGVLARAVAVNCKIKGGVMMQLLGPVPRYATRELQYMGMMGPGSEQQAVSGREFMGVLSKAQDYLLAEQQRDAAAEKEREKALPTPNPATPKSAPPVPPPSAPNSASKP